MRYFAQYRAGLGELVIDSLRRDLAGVQVISSDDSSLLFDSRSDRAKVGGLGYLKNAFTVLGSVPRSTPQKAAERFAEQVQTTPMLRGQGRVTSFRTMVSVDGKLVGLPRPAKLRLESAIGKATGARVNARGGAGAEYWVIGRRDLSSMLFCQRLTSGVKQGAAGSLGADLATLLVKASEPAPDDVFLDPFAGSGAIVSARMASAYRRLIYSDLAAGEPQVQILPELRRGKRVTLLTEDALELPSVPTGSVSAIVTDPPWGEYDELDVDLSTFARQMMQSFDRVLDPERGRLVLLVSRRVADVTARLWKTAGLELAQSHELLVNGHPASAQVGARSRRTGDRR
ncbi:putative RNA methylase [Kribbella flavida DSM 17836]|uniref:Putative RNA methylase n=1 Tax=Kribbella flavida (strain DSM 17836 / JCM 10339 / NBRC 14399) TaxID=479435 RepID=D2Q0F4_KRIFD|nr:putative RNA methylase [Kribbella flavida]ADB31946.1 putative RNA methylase [Kribbella flavida DSM 17836]